VKYLPLCLAFFTQVEARLAWGQVCVCLASHSEGTAVAVNVMTAYRGSGGIFLLYLTTALIVVNSTLGNYWMRAEWAPRRVWAFLEIWSAHSAAYSPATADGVTLVHKLSLNFRSLCCVNSVVLSRFCPFLYHILDRKIILI
jgi:hypothetical protein